MNTLDSPEKRIPRVRNRLRHDPDDAGGARGIDW